MKTFMNSLNLLSYRNIKQVPLILQSEVSECGLASLAMISSYFGHLVNVSSLRKHIILGSQGMNLRQMIEVSSELGFTSRALQCDIHEIKNLTLPCILHWNMDHFIVLTRVSKKSIWINDPAMGKRKLSWDEFGQSYTGIALELLPNSSFKKKDGRNNMKVSQLWEKIIGLRRSLFSLLMVSIIIQFISLLSPYYMQWVIDNVLVSNDKDFLIVLAYGFTLLMVTRVLVDLLRSWLMLRLSSAINIQMGSNLFSHLIKLPMSYFSNRHVGDIFSRFGSLSSIRELLTTGIIESIIDGLMAIVVLVMMFLYSTQLSLFVLTLVAFSFFIQLIFYYPSKRTMEEAIVANAKEDTSFLESLRAIQTIKLFSHEATRHNTWLNRYAESINADIRIGKLTIWEAGIDSLIQGFGSIVIIYLGAMLVIDGKLTVGMLIAFIAYKGQFTVSISELINKAFSFKMLSVHLDRLSDIVLEKQESSISGVNFSKFEGHLKIEGLYFRYSDNSEWLIKNLSFEIKPGESLAITGASGCGKSTLMKLMLGLIKPTRGRILIDGKNISEIALSNYRKNLGSVMQTDTLLSGTVAENVTMFDHLYDEERLLKCCQDANILDEIKSLPMGFHTLVGDMGSNFSGGQLQRIFLARALYKNPSILFLDESTSHLDIDNEIIINQNIKKMAITRVIVAHKESTIKSVDRVLCL